MRRALVRCLLPCALMAWLLLAGCTATVVQVRTEAAPTPPPRSFWEALEGDATSEKYAAILRRISKDGIAGSGHGSGCSTSTGRPTHQRMHFSFFVLANAPALAEVLDDLLEDVKAQAAATGATVGTPRFEVAHGTLRKFVLDCKQGKDEVHVVGYITQPDAGSKWEFRLEAERTFRPDE
jgi:hypothetical protein